MPKEWAQLSTALADINLDGAEEVLKAMGKTVIDEIVAMIDREEQPDGSPQKQNSPEYAAAKLKLKGYKTPLKGIDNDSPYLARHTGTAWVRQFVSPDTLHIYLKPKRWYIGLYLQEKGYWFMGITKRAEELIRQRAVKWFRNKLYKASGRGFD